MTIRAKNPEILDTIIAPVSINVIKFERNSTIRRLF